LAAEIVFPHGYVILDACCVINLHESEKMSDILASLQAFVAVTDYVYQEEILPPEEGGASKLLPLVESGLLTVTVLESEDEMIAFVNFAAVMDDGEASSSAIAVSRGWAIATDDQKAIRFLEQNVSGVKIVTTLDLVKHWVDREHPPAEAVRMALENIRNRARYIPHARHPLFRWWNTHISDGADAHPS